VRTRTHQHNDETDLVVDDAIKTLALVEGHDADSLAAKDLHAAVTLTRATRSRMSTLVADARDEDVTWADIGRILGSGRLWALCRYGPLVRRRRTPLTLD